MIKVSIVLHENNEGWILEKFAQKIANALDKNKYNVQVSRLPDKNAEIIFWMHYLNVDLSLLGKPKIHFAVVPHVDHPKKLAQLQKITRNDVNLICFSKELENKLKVTFPNNSKILSLEFGNDLAPKERKFIIGMASNIYSDGRKNEKWISEFGVKYFHANIKFVFIGKRWEETVETLTQVGLECEIYNSGKNIEASYEVVIDQLKKLDLCIYTGFDEGSLGALDAYMLGIPLLISKQGFHLEFGLDETSYFVNNSDFEIKLLNKVESFHAYQRLRIKYDWLNIATRLDSIFESRLKVTLSGYESDSLRDPTLKSRAISSTFLIVKYYFELMFSKKKRGK